MKKTDFQPDKQLAAVCGLFCPSCMIYIASHSTPERRQKIADGMQRPVESMVCEGCRSDQRYVYCQSCKMSACAAEKGFDFCSECADYPCDELKQFQAERPHRLELWQSLERIKEAGYETWFAEMLEHYACPACETINSAYQLTCQECGTSPSSAYVAEHKEAITAFFSSRK